MSADIKLKKEQSNQTDKKILSTTQINIPYKAKHRGVIKPERLKIWSKYSFGFFTTWTWLEFGCDIIVYPQTKALPEAWMRLSANNSDHSNNPDNDLPDELDDKIALYSNDLKGQGNEDFDELRKYIQGEPLTHVAWKHLARGQGWLSKSYQGVDGCPQWLKLQAMPATNVEEKLQYLCYLVLEFHQQGIVFGVDLSYPMFTQLDHRILPAQGDTHLQACLLALALFGNISAKDESESPNV